MEGINWGLKLNQILEERGITKAELAKKTGLSEPYLSRACKGHYRGVERSNFERIARALAMTPAQLSQELYGERSLLPKETPDQILERFRTVLPATVPMYEDFPFHAGEPVEPMDYLAMVRDRVRGRNLEGYITRGKCLEPHIGDGDIIIVDRDGQVDIGNIVACLCGGELYLGRLRRIADELWLENNKDRIKLDACQVAAPVVEVRKRLK